jgi:hypothetical protein
MDSAKKHQSLQPYITGRLWLISAVIPFLDFSILHLLVHQRDSHHEAPKDLQPLLRGMVQ